MKSLMLLVFAIALLMAPFGLNAQQEPAQTPAAPQAQAPAQPETRKPYKHHRRHGDKMDYHKQKMAEHATMMKEMDDRLAAKVAAMDAAKGDQKVEAMAAVIKELVAQRKQMHDHMMKAHHGKMGHPGYMRGGGKMPADCPMMEGGGMPADRPTTKPGASGGEEKPKSM